MKYLSSYRIVENVQQSKALMNRLKIPLNDSDYLKIRDMISGHDGYAYWFTKLRFVDKVQVENLQNIWDIIQSKDGLTSYFTKRIVDMESMEEFLDEVEKAKLKKSAKSVLDQFPSHQKDLFDLKSDEDVIMLSNLSKSKSLKSLIRKISSYKDKKSLVDATNRLLNTQSDGGFDRILHMAVASGADIKYQSEENEIIICQVNYDQIRKIGGDTSWCIVRDRGTFDSYASGGFQWVVFLTDMQSSDRLSKIGVTTNIDYITAHDKYDGYVQKNRIVEILKEREFDFRNLLLSNDLISQMKDWTSLSVGLLIDRGFSKSVIIEKKKVFKLNYYNRGTSYKPDLSYFTPEEIESNDLNDRAELDISVVKGFTKEYILSKNCLDRLTHGVSLAQIFDIGFTKDEIIRHELYKKIDCLCTYLSTVFKNFTKEEIISNRIFDYCYIDSDSIPLFTKEEVIKYGILNNASGIMMESLFGIGFTKDELISKYLNSLEGDIVKIVNHFKGLKKSEILRKLHHMWSDEWEQLGVGRDESKKQSIKLKIMILFNIDSSNVPLIRKEKGGSSLSDIFGNESSNLNASLLSSIYKLGYKIESEDSLKIFLYLIRCGESDRSWSKYKFDELVKLHDIVDLFDKNGSKIIMSYINDKIDTIPSSVRDRYGVYDYKECLGFYNFISTKHPDIYDRIYNKIRTLILSYPTAFRTASGRDDRFDVEETIKFLNFFKVKSTDLSYISFGDIFNESRVYRYDTILKYLENIGYKLSEDEKFKLIEKINSIYEREGRKDTEYYSFLISNKIHVDDSYHGIFKIIDEARKLEDSEILKIEKIFKGSGYEEDLKLKLEKLQKRKLYDTVRSELEKSTRRIRNKTIDTKTQQDWYDKYFDIYLSTRPDSENEWRSHERDLDVLVLLSKLGKFEDLDKIDWRFLPREGRADRYESFDDNLVHTIAKICCGFNRTYEDIGISNENIKKLYEWVEGKVGSDVRAKKYLQVCYYKFDRPKFEEYLNIVRKTKDNAGYYSSQKDEKGDNILKYRTNRLSMLRYTISYLANNDQFEEIKNIVKSIPMTTQQERKLANETLNRISVNYKERDKWSDFKSTLIPIRVERSKKIKESFILSWSDFSLLK